MSDHKTGAVRHGRAGRRWWVALLLVLAVGCGEEEAVQQVYEVRGRFVGPAYEGQAFIADHEAIPGYMEPMRMTFKVRDPAELAELATGDPISFDLVLTDTDVYVENIEVLPSGTELELAARPPVEAPPAAPADSL